MKKNMINTIIKMICDYEKYTGEKPYVILISYDTYMELGENLIKATFTSIDTQSTIRYICGIPIEISDSINVNAICMNKRDYEKYIWQKHFLNKVDSILEENERGIISE